jgi:S1-C subfamily serine protease
VTQQQSYYVLEIRYLNRPPETRSITAPRTVIGREAGDVVLGDPQASSMHAEIDFDNGRIIVRDLGSSNGTWHGGRSLPQFAVSEGDTFRCAQTELRVVSIVGGQPLPAGGTVLGDQSPLAAMRAQGAVPGQSQAPSQKSGTMVGIVIAAVVGGFAVLGTASYLVYRHLAASQAEELAAAEAADTNTEATGEPAQDPEETQSTGPAPETEKDLREIYRQVGAATVVVRVPGSVGTGGIIDARGVVLTNHHVISRGERDGLKVKANVTLGKFSDAENAFEPEPEPYEAYVLKVDEDRDLALVQLVDPPADLAPIELAKEAPSPGQKIAAVGHAGAGMLWAIKGGEVSATGSLAGHADLALESSRGFEREFLAQMKAKMEKQGRVIQSTAEILPGDSGGPLVNMFGRIVGVNAFGRIDQVTGQWLSFHIHLDEVRDFVEDIPQRPLELIPDPWAMADSKVTYADVDLDGTTDTLVLAPAKLVGKSGYYLDLDQNSLAGGEQPALDELLESKKFDAELAMLSSEGKRHLWYDTDNDGRFDVYMVDPSSLGRFSEGYRIAGDGSTTLDGSLEGDGINGFLFEDGSLRDRLRRVGPVVFPGLLRTGPGGTVAVPEPLGKAGDNVTVQDSDGDGTPEVFVERALFHGRVLFDLDQNSGARTGSVVKARLASKSLDVEVAFLSQGSALWMWYDTDDDGRFDLLLESSSRLKGAVQRASRLDAGGRRTKIDDHVGRLLVRPDLLSTTTTAERFGKAAAVAFGPLAVPRSADALGTFPSAEASSTSTIFMREVKGFENAVAVVTDIGRDVVIVDVDKSAMRGRGKPADAVTKIREGKFDPEFALLRMGGVSWAYYDTDGRKGYDLVVVGNDSGSPIHAYALDGATATSVDKGTSMVQWGRFTSKKLRTSFQKLAKKIYAGTARE